MSKENRVPDERLVEIIGYINGHAYVGPKADDMYWLLTELQSLRSKPVAGVEVKPLVWHGPDMHGEIHARSILCVYTIRAHMGSLGHWLTEVGSYHPSVEAAKAAAEADYRQRILSTLSLPAQEPVAYLVHGLGWDEYLSAEQALRLQTKVPGLDYTPLYASPQPEAVITEEMVERAAHALHKEAYRSDEAAEETWEEYADQRRCMARAALTAALKEA